VVNPVNGNVYVVFNDKGAGTDKADIFFTQSTNSGATWSAPVRVNDDSTTNDQWQPTIAVRPDGAQLFISYYDRRLDPSNSLIDVFGAIADISDGTVTFEPNFRITTASFPVVIRQDPVVSPTYMGDYDQSAADNNFFYVTWGDNRLANPTFRRTRINRMCVSQSFSCSPALPGKQTVTARASRHWRSSLAASMQRPQPWAFPA